MSTNKLTNDNTDLETSINRVRAVLADRESPSIPYKEIKDSAVVAALKVDQSNLTNWRKRGTYPWEVFAAFCGRENISLDWLSLGRGEHGINHITFRVDEAGADYGQLRTIPVVGDWRPGNIETVPVNKDKIGVRLPAAWLEHDAYCVFMVAGDSMTGVGIHQDDIVIVENDDAVENGHVCLVDMWKTFTVKRYWRTEHGAILRPENPTHVETRFDDKESRDIHVIGPVQYVIKSLRGK